VWWKNANPPEGIEGGRFVFCLGLVKRGKEVIPEVIAKKTSSNLVEIRGHTFTLYKPPRPARKKNL
jgi:RNA-binding protein YhbY